MTPHTIAPLAPRVILACSGAGHVVRGYERVTEEMAARLKQHVNLTLVRGGGPWIWSDGVRLPCVQRMGAVARLFTHSNADAYALEQRTFAAGLYALTRASGAEVVHLHDPAVMTLMWHARQRLGGRFRLIFTNGGLLDPEHLHRPDLLHVLTPVDERRMLAAGIPAERVVSVPYGVDVPPLQRERPASPTLRVIGVGALTRAKGVDVAIKAAAPLKDLELTFLGQRCPDTVLLEELARARMAGRCVLRTAAPEDVRMHLEAADVFILPTVAEGFGMAVLEAMAAGLPCIVSDLPILRWLVGEGGTFVPSGDERAWMDALLSMTPERRMVLGSRARVRAQQLSWDRLVPAYVDMYRAAARQGGRTVAATTAAV